MNVGASEQVVVFRTGQLFEIDMASNRLKEKGIPHFTREETSAGLRVAMPAAPATGPGVWWCVLVPAALAREARDELAALPFCQGTNPGVWGFKPRPGVRLGWKIYAALVLLVGAACFLLALWSQEPIARP